MKLWHVLVVGVVFFSVSSCAKKLPVAYDQVQDYQYINIQTKSGNSYKGVVRKKDSNFLILQGHENVNSLDKIARQNIQVITSKPPAFDYNNKIISEFDISKIKTNHNLMLYTVGGAGLSFGVSFFTGFMTQRGLSDSDSQASVLWGITTLGTLGGTTWFAHKGKKKDREVAIERIRDYRYLVAKKEINNSKARREEVTNEVKKLQEERARQDAELKALMERLKNKQKK